MIINETTGEPFTASINGAPATTVRQHIETYQLSNEDDVKEFANNMDKGRDIVVQFQIGDVAYILAREFIPTKIALAPTGAVK